MYPIAEITGTPYDQFFYTGFEDSDGTVGSSKTGLKSRPGGYSKSIYGLTTGTYVLSYWQKQIDGSWSFVPQDVSVSTNPYLLSIPTTVQLDELRFYPKSPITQFSTFTYDPLIGMTSKMDANNKIEYYEYDLNERLKLIRDNSKNIMKTFGYQYQYK